MNNVQRWDKEHDYSMCKDPQGAFVHYEDYEAMFNNRNYWMDLVKGLEKAIQELS